MAKSKLLTNKTEKKNNRNLVSVIMPVYNSDKYISLAIDSILKQTYKNFEFIIIDDNSNDNSSQIIDSYEDKRIIHIINEKKIGLVKSLNLGINIAKGEFIARMDADDISIHNRLELQIERFLINNVGVVGGQTYYIDNKGTIFGKTNFPLENTDIKEDLLFRTPFAHPSVMIRKSVLIDNNIYYDENDTVAEDYGLWSRLMNITNFENIDEVILYYRITKKSLTKQSLQNMGPLLNVLGRSYKRVLDNYNVTYTKFNSNFVHLLLAKNTDAIKFDDKKEFIKTYKKELEKVVKNKKLLNYNIGLLWLKLAGMKCILIGSPTIIMFSILAAIKYIGRNISAKVRKNKIDSKRSDIK